MMQLPKAHAPLTYTKHPNNMHEFVFHHDDSNTINIFFDYLEDLLEEEAELQLLLDLRHYGANPVQHVQKRSQTLTQKHPLQIAIIYHQANAFINALGDALDKIDTTDTDIRFYHDSEYYQAKDWLRRHIAS